MIDYSKLKVDKLREMLLEMGCEEEQIKKLKGKKQLVQAHQSLIDELGIEETEDEVVYGDENWSNAVMEQFLPDELDQHGNPKIHGLRRVTQIVIGPIISSGVKQLFPATEDGPGRASAVVEIIIAWQHNREDLRSFTSCAGSWHGNTDDEFAAYPEAMAETRAEARALRKILGLTTVSADEITTKNTSEIVEQYVDKTTTGEYGQDGEISDAQKTIIRTLCGRLKIDIDKFINSGKESYNSIDEVSRLKAIDMIKMLNRYQTETVEIPEEIK